jgi:hypothetical protein
MFLQIKVLHFEFGFHRQAGVYTGNTPTGNGNNLFMLKVNVRVASG